MGCLFSSWTCSRVANEKKFLMLASFVFFHFRKPEKLMTILFFFSSSSNSCRCYPSYCLTLLLAWLVSCIIECPGIKVVKGRMYTILYTINRQAAGLSFRFPANNKTTGWLKTFRLTEIHWLKPLRFKNTFKCFCVPRFSK